VGSGSGEAGGVVMNDRGYVFTLIISMMVLITLSLVLFYSQVSSPAFEDKSRRMSLESLHYFTQSLEEDAARSLSIAGQRATTYAIDHILLTNETYTTYEMVPCNGFNYSGFGVEAAIAEIMVCGTLNNAGQDAGNIELFMEDNTVMDWVGRVEGMNAVGMPYNTSVTFRNLTIGLFSPWHYAIVAVFDFNVWDDEAGNHYRGQNTRVVGVVDISMMEDPAYHFFADTPVAMKTFSRCPRVSLVNGTVLDEWIDLGCYLEGESSPTFFDRVEGRRENILPRFRRNSESIRQVLGGGGGGIGLESLLDVGLLEENNVTINGNLSHVDYMYWGGHETSCMVEGMVRNPGFRIDPAHAAKYGVVGLNCFIKIENTSGGYYFNMNRYAIPPGAMITWVDTTGKEQGIRSIPSLFEETVPANGFTQTLFNVTGTYSVRIVDELGLIELQVTNNP
jgi:hypothetical protein